MNALLEVQDLHVEIEGKPILNGVDLTIAPGEVHALMGPNGSGKTTLAHTLAGHPSAEPSQGVVRFRGEDLLERTPEERARAGLFLAFQYPSEITGVSVANFLRRAVTSVRGAEIPVLEFHRELVATMKLLEMEVRFAERYLNDGFSGGEKKRNEMLQMTLLKPRLAVLDETDSGLDIDAIQVVSKAVNELRDGEFGALVITHYQRILKHLKPDYVHVLAGGRIVRSGGAELAEELERDGYDFLKAERN